MKTHKLIRISAIGLLLLLLASAAIYSAVLSTQAANAQTSMSFDIAEDMARFAFDPDLTFEDGMPKHGSAFITQGYIYPAGTISCSDGVCSGVNADGSPEFPAKVIGEWTCRGWFVGEGAHATSGPIVITTQLYNFGVERGNDMLASEGYELADVGVAIKRAISGGTGQYSQARGEAEQTFLGFNASQGVSLRLQVELDQVREAKVDQRPTRVVED